MNLYRTLARLRRAVRPTALSLALALPAALAAAPAAGNGDDPLKQYKWTARPIIVFAESERDPRFVQQMEELEEARAEMDERDVVVLVDIDDGASRADASELRKIFRPHDFNVLLLGKDGQVKLRRPSVVSGEQLVRQIDRMPMRQQEMGRR